MSNYKEFDTAFGTAKYIAKSVFGAATYALVSSIFSTDVEGSIKRNYVSLNNIPALFNATIDCVNKEGYTFLSALDIINFSLTYTACIENTTRQMCGENEIQRFTDIYINPANEMNPIIRLPDCFDITTNGSTSNVFIIVPEI